MRSQIDVNTKIIHQTKAHFNGSLKSMLNLRDLKLSQECQQPHQNHEFPSISDSTTAQTRTTSPEIYYINILDSAKSSQKEASLIFDNSS